MMGELEQPGPTPGRRSGGRGAGRGELEQPGPTPGGHEREGGWMGVGEGGEGGTVVNGWSAGGRVGGR